MTVQRVVFDYGLFLAGEGFTLRWRGVGSLSVREMAIFFPWPSLGPSTVSFRLFGFFRLIASMIPFKASQCNELIPNIPPHNYKNS
jgi:hypothetical protein